MNRSRRVMDAVMLAHRIAFAELGPRRWHDPAWLARLDFAYARYLPGALYRHGAWL